MVYLGLRSVAFVLLVTLRICYDETISWRQFLVVGWSYTSCAVFCIVKMSNTLYQTPKKASFGGFRVGGFNYSELKPFHMSCNRNSYGTVRHSRYQVRRSTKE